jgi:peptidoglycan hydrolase CwlO-like protein
MTQAGLSKDYYFGALLEDIQSQIMRLAEAMAGVPEDVRQLKADMTEVKQDIRVIKFVVKDHNHIIDDHEIRIGKFRS